MVPFKVGDRVTVVAYNNPASEPREYVGKSGKVVGTAFSAEWPFRVSFDEGPSEAFSADELRPALGNEWPYRREAPYNPDEGCPVVNAGGENMGLFCNHPRCDCFAEEGKS